MARIHDDNPDPAGRGDRRAIRKAPLTGDILPAQSRPGPFDEDDDELPSAEDRERFGGVTKTCPECGQEVYDNTAVCYHCGHAFGREAPGTSRAPIWIVVTVAVLLVAFVLAYLL